MSKPKPDNRSDNAAKIKAAMDATKRNMEAADEMIARTDNPEVKADLEAKNERREDALRGMEVERKQEAAHKKEQH
jgi:small acid-soluble spore protein (thioredoxin-like protein)